MDLVSPEIYKIFNNSILRMKKIVNKTRKGTAGSYFASAVNFFMTVDQCTICSQIKATGMLVRK